MISIVPGKNKHIAPALLLCKLGDYQDYIYKSGDKWYVHKETGKYVYNNDLSENGIGSTYVAMLTPTLPTLPNMAFTDGLFWCDSYTSVMQNNTGLQGTNASARIRVNTSLSIADSYAAVRALAAANNLTVYYPLATPTDTEITNEALVAQLETLAAATMYNPQTNITTLYAEGNEQPTLDASYFTDKNPDTRDELIIDSRLRTITLNGLDVYHLQAPGSEFLMLAPGENRLSLQSDITGDNGYAQVSYKQGYLSI